MIAYIFIVIDINLYAVQSVLVPHLPTLFIFMEDGMGFMKDGKTSRSIPRFVI